MSTEVSCEVGAEGQLVRVEKCPLKGQEGCVVVFGEREEAAILAQESEEHMVRVSSRQPHRLWISCCKGFCSYSVV